jgi:hypothetical protein
MAVGLAVLGAGIGDGIDNIVSHAHGQDWTVSAGGSLVGVGAALLLVGVLLRRGASWWSYVLVVLGAIGAGYSLGGGIDDLLREMDGQSHHFMPGMLCFGLGIGLCVVGMLTPRRTA